MEFSATMPATSCRTPASPSSLIPHSFPTSRLFIPFLTLIVIASMDFSLLPFSQQPMLRSLHRPQTTLSTEKGFTNRGKRSCMPCRCSSKDLSARREAMKIISLNDLSSKGRRWFIGLFIAAVSGFNNFDIATAVSTSRRALRGAKVPESDFTALPNGLKYYDLKVGEGLEAVKGSRVAVHYVAKWRGVTFMTSRQGLGVTGGTPYGFDVGQSEKGNVLKGLDLGVQGMRVGGQRLLIVPPKLAYGSKGVQEIPPNATIELDVELLSIKQSPFGSSVKIIEG